MKRLRHWLFNFVATIALALFVAAIMLWVRSYSAGDLIRYIGAESVAGSKSFFLLSTTGRIQLSCYVDPGPPGPFVVADDGRLPDGISFSHWDSRAKPFQMPNHALLNRMGFDARAKELPLGTDYVVVVPYYALAMAAFGVGALAYLRRRLLLRSQAVGRCSVCGYDLRATPDQCPECGTIPGKA